MKDKNLIKFFYMSNTSEIKKWFADRGDYTHNITYNLNENSVIMDLGGYTGVWAKQMIDKYNPNVYILEPIPKFYNIMFNKFKGNDKVRLLNVGISTENKDDTIFLNGDGSSSNIKKGGPIKVKFNDMNTILDNWNLNSVDLLQINIEGDEYPLLDNLINNGIIKKFKNIQIQFHLNVSNAVYKRDKIIEGLKNNGFNLKFDYPFVWESWYQ